MMFLTPADLQALTGYRRAHEQIKWLRARRRHAAPTGDHG